MASSSTPVRTGLVPNSSTSNRFSIFTSLRFDPQLLSSAVNTAASSLQIPTPFYLLSHHRDRMLAAVTHFSYPPAATLVLQSLEAYTLRLEEAIDSCGHGRDGPLKLKPILTRDGEFIVEVSPTPAVPLSQLFPESLPDRAPEEWQVIIDTQPTPPSSFTSFKTTAREMYDSARLRGGIRSWAEKSEVVLWNEEKQAMEGSLTSLYVQKDGRWVTPIVESGGQQGTTRRWALENGLATEEVLTIGDDLKSGSWVVVSNGVRGFWGGWAV